MSDFTPQIAIGIIKKSNELLSAQMQKVMNAKSEIQTVGLTEKYYSVLENCKNEYEACKTAISALEKQIPKRPVYNCNNEIIHCPNCDYDLMGGVELDSESAPEHCWKCGQKLDWSDESDGNTLKELDSD